MRHHSRNRRRAARSPAVSPCPAYDTPDDVNPRHKYKYTCLQAKSVPVQPLSLLMMNASIHVPLHVKSLTKQRNGCILQCGSFRAVANGRTALCRNKSAPRFMPDFRTFDADTVLHCKRLRHENHQRRRCPPEFHENRTVMQRNG